MTGIYRDQLRHVFFPYLETKVENLISKGHHLIYYTTSETAYKVIINKEIWMRHTSMMNDYSEVSHGYDCLLGAYRSKSGDRLKRAIDKHHPNLSDEAAGRFDDWWHKIKTETYIACLSEHSNQAHKDGRLSMWRAYGGKAGVALVVKPTPLFLPTKRVGLEAGAVAYWTQAQLEREFRKVAERIEDNADYVRSMNREYMTDIIFRMFRFAVLCIKHPGFTEEQEWRILASPWMYDSSLLTQDIEVISGIPQIVQKLSLDISDTDVTGANITDFLARIIIGPCSNSDTIYMTFHELLQKHNFPEPEKLIHDSKIPLRV
ncbi:MAG: DUF2971 domain-containing protein [Methylococcaceae bacterium]|nr:DUF2971 domain-containing protein [Methylococcaceae bacterium]